MLGGNVQVSSIQKQVFTKVVKETTYHEDQFLASTIMGVKKANMQYISVSFTEK